MANLETQLKAPNGQTWTQPLGLFINNEFVSSLAGETITSVDPATELDIATVQAAGVEDVDRAVRAAYAAVRNPAWRGLSATDRGSLLARLADLLEENKELLATVDAWDNGEFSLHQSSTGKANQYLHPQGKTYNEALEGDLFEAITTIRYYAGWGDKVVGQTITSIPGKLAYTLRQPIGVVAQIIPWNYPLSMATWKLGPALACGNAVVLKAAEQTPLSLLILAGLVREAGFPPGVVNLINGLGAKAGPALVSHPLVDKVAFTGSTATATRIMALAAGSLKNISLETGGKSPLLVFPDADLEQAVRWAHFGIMSNQGQICTATSRLLVHADIFDAFVSAFVARVEANKIGTQWDVNAFQGPQVSGAQRDRIISYIEAGRASGARVLTGGKPVTINETGKGYFVAPTVFADVTPEMSIWKDEIFGPVAVIVKFGEESEAVRLANDSVYGLGAAVFTMNLEVAHRVASDIESGMVWINSSQDCDPRIPFGGVKQSGIGRELGEAGLEAYTQIKAVHVNLGNRL